MIPVLLVPALSVPAAAAPELTPHAGPALDVVRAMPWSPAILGAGAAATITATYALTRRHPGEGSLGLAAAGACAALALAEMGRGALGVALAWVACTLAAAGALVAESVRRVPGAPRTAPGNEQRLLALGTVGLLGGAWTVAGLAVDWDQWNPQAASALVTGLALAGAGLTGLLTRRHWVSLAQAGAVVCFGLVLVACALPGEAGGSFARALLAFAWGGGMSGLALASSALRRGHGPWVEPLEESAS